jgi:hypothetical protein
MDTARLIDVKRMAELSSIHPSRLKMLAATGKIPAYKPTHKWLFDPDEVIKYIKQTRPHKNIITL